MKIPDRREIEGCMESIAEMVAAEPYVALGFDDFKLIDEINRIIGEGIGWQILGLALRETFTHKKPSWGDLGGYVGYGERKAIEAAYVTIAQLLMDDYSPSSPFGEYPTKE